jgi:hypothetical protein
MNDNDSLGARAADQGTRRYSAESVVDALAGIP